MCVCVCQVFLIVLPFSSRCRILRLAFQHLENIKTPLKGHMDVPTCKNLFLAMIQTSNLTDRNQDKSFGLGCLSLVYPVPVDPVQRYWVTSSGSHKSSVQKSVVFSCREFQSCGRSYARLTFFLWFASGATRVQGFPYVVCLRPRIYVPSSTSLGPAPAVIKSKQQPYGTVLCCTSFRKTFRKPQLKSLFSLIFPRISPTP